MFPDQTLYVEMPVSAHKAVAILLQSDLMPSLYIPDECLEPGVNDPELQERCQEAGFMDRLVSLALR